MTIPINSCQKCNLFMLNKSCVAFKNIPAPIWEGINNHKKKYKGDKGYRFEPVKKK